MVDIVEGVSPINYLDDYDLVLVGTNCYQVMRNGFQFEIAHKFPYVQEINYSTKYGDIKKVGTYIECSKENKPTILLGFVSFGYNFKGDNKCFFDYNALRQILRLINITYRGKHIVTTMLGITEFDGNANKEEIIKIFNEETKNINVTIFDYKQEYGSIIKQKEYYNKLKRKK